MDRTISPETNRQREKLCARLPQDVQENVDDPLAPYDSLVQWIITNYGEEDPNSGLMGILKKATDAFKNDPQYKTDLRYFKMWSALARNSSRAEALEIYAYLISKSIGTNYASLYEEYTHLLEKVGRLNDAEAIYRQGIKAQPRALERLKTSYKAFKARKAGSSQTSVASASSTQSSSTVMPLYTDSTPASRYASMLAPPAPGKRPEILKFDLNLLFTADGVEYSNNEARARSMGLLNKKWAPPPASEMHHATVNVRFNDDGQRATTNLTGRRKSWMTGVGEPTVTINTKEALADVFGMYNSPEKTLKLPGSKHAPTRTVPLTPALRLAQEQPQTKTPVLAFRPYSDENAGTARKDKSTPLTKFRPYSDDDADENSLTPKRTPPHKPQEKSEHSQRDVFTEDLGRATPAHVISHQRAQSHEIPPSVFRPAPVTKPNEASTVDENASARTPFRVFSRPPGEGSSSTVTPRTFTPFVDAQPAAATFTPFKDPNAGTMPAFTPFQDSKPVPAFTPFKDPAPVPAFTPFKDPAPVPAFTPFKDPAPAFTPFKGPAFTPFKDPAPAFTPFKEVQPATFTPFKDLPSEPEATKKPAIVPFVDKLPPIPDAPFEPSVSTSSTASSWTPEGEDADQYQDEYEYDDDVLDIDEYQEEDESFRDDQQVIELNDQQEIEENGFPLGGRWGAFSTLTPITERTFEFTGHGSFAATTPGSSTSDLVSAHQLTDVPHEEDEHDGPLEPFRLVQDYEDEDISVIELKTGALSLANAMTGFANFRPPNPCNPFEPNIVSTIISLLPSDDEFHDLRPHSGDQIASLQKFAKKARKTSGNSNSGNAGVLDVGSFPLVLGERKFHVSEKLGEGAFGLVFKANEVKQQSDDSDDSDDDMDEDQDDSVVAVKVVKPANIWEYHALRRLHSTLSASLQRSVIRPRALYMFADESYLVLDISPQGTLLNVVNNAVASGVSQLGGLLDELLVIFFAIELLRILEGMHSTGFIHGDLKIDNCLLRLEETAEWDSQYHPSGEAGWNRKGIKLIDFGRAIDTRLFPERQQYLADWAAEEHDCPEIRHEKPWTYHSDYFGLVGIIYCMLFGQHIKVDSVVVADGRSKIATPLKRYWQKELWTRLFDILLNPSLFVQDSETTQLPLLDELGAVRKNMEQWLQENGDRGGNTLKRLLKKVELHILSG